MRLYVADIVAPLTGRQGNIFGISVQPVLKSFRLFWWEVGTELDTITKNRLIVFISSVIDVDNNKNWAEYRALEDAIYNFGHLEKSAVNV